MDILALVLRFLHIGGAVTWVGGVFFFLAVLDPLLKRLPPEESGKLGRHLQLRSKMHILVPVSAVVTVVAGITLSFVIPADKLYPWTTTQGLVFNIGSLAGVLALVPGITAGVQSAKMRKQAAAFEAKPSAELGRALAARAARVSMFTKAAAGFMVVALFCMSTFRYWV